MKSRSFKPKWYSLLILAVVTGLFVLVFVLPLLFGSGLGDTPVSDFVAELSNAKKLVNEQAFGLLNVDNATKEDYSRVAVYQRVSAYDENFKRLPEYDLISKKNPVLSSGITAETTKKGGTVEFSHSSEDGTDVLTGLLRKGFLQFKAEHSSGEREQVLFCQAVKTGGGYVYRFVDYDSAKGICVAYVTAFDSGKLLCVQGECDYNAEDEYPNLTDNFEELKATIRNAQVFELELPQSEDKPIAEDI